MNSTNTKSPQNCVNKSEKPNYIHQKNDEFNPIAPNSNEGRQTHSSPKEYENEVGFQNVTEIKRKKSKKLDQLVKNEFKERRLLGTASFLNFRNLTGIKYEQIWNLMK